MMRPIGFEKLLRQSLKEYRENKSLFGVPIEASVEVPVKIGPAAGPHTQLAQNIVAAYGAGASYFELKTVQVLEGDALGLQKPCIYVGEETYNTEWSTELSVAEALEEYIKAWFLIHLLKIEFHRTEEVIFNLSVGYNLEGIQSQKITHFINCMKDARLSPVWEKCQQVVLRQKASFKTLTLGDLESISPFITRTVTLSTMHGCPKAEIEAIGTYLLQNAQLDLWIKCNPTLLGVNRIKEIWSQMGYDSLSFEEAQFEQDMKLPEAIELIENLQQKAKAVGRCFGVKLTNTFPVKIQHQELQGETMYLSGKALYPLALGTAELLATHLKGALKISYSGGADLNNMRALAETGMQPITFSSFLLKPGGYKNIGRLKQKLINCKPPETINLERLTALAKAACLEPHYFKETKKHRQKAVEKDWFCGKCNNCIDVCPNRANVCIIIEGKKVTVHLAERCNECGNCSCFCPMGHEPYKDKLTIFTDETEFNQSKASGFVVINKALSLVKVRWGKTVLKGSIPSFGGLPNEFKKIMEEWMWQDGRF